MIVTYILSQFVYHVTESEMYNLKQIEPLVLCGGKFCIMNLFFF
jgi:hypothetical protein